MRMTRAAYILGLKEKWGKSLTEKMLMLYFANKQEEFFNDFSSMPSFFDPNVPYTILVRDYNTAGKLSTKLELDVNLVVLGGYVSPVSNTSFDDLNHKFLENYSGTVILLFENTPEAQVTEDLLKERYKHINFFRIPYGVSVKNPSQSDKETLYLALKKIMNEK